MPDIVKRRKKRPGNPSFAIRLSPDRRAAYDFAAEKQGKDTGQWARDILDSAALEAVAASVTKRSA